jgi:hypothetical protein
MAFLRGFAAATILAATTAAGTGKRGAAYNNNNDYGDATYANMLSNYSQVTWGYDWGFPSYNLSSNLELYLLLFLPSQ